MGTFTVWSLQQALATFLFFGIGAIGWSCGMWLSGKALKR
jgi:hypothetical protein